MLRSKFPIEKVVVVLRRFTRRLEAPSVTQVSRSRDPFLVLVATVLSLRTKDETTERAAARLFRAARTPRGLLRLRRSEIEKRIYPVSFYRTKAGRLREIARALIRDHGGGVPDDMDSLLALEGVGRKTANLVLSLAHGKPAICVDVHVHRITNRWGYVSTRGPEETEFRLREILPRPLWRTLNDLLVMFGKALCRPVSPWCSRCPIARYCRRVNVGRCR